VRFVLTRPAARGSASAGFAPMAGSAITQSRVAATAPLQVQMAAKRVVKRPVKRVVKKPVCPRPSPRTPVSAFALAAWRSHTSGGAHRSCCRSAGEEGCEARREKEGCPEEGREARRAEEDGQARGGEEEANRSCWRLGALIYARVPPPPPPPRTTLHPHPVPGSQGAIKGKGKIGAEAGWATQGLNLLINLPK